MQNGERNVGYNRAKSARAVLSASTQSGTSPQTANSAVLAALQEVPASSDHQTNHNEAVNTDSSTKPATKRPKKTFSVEQQAAIRDLFESVYLKNRARVIGTNFLRGIAFGFGSLVGGTIVVAILVWILTQTVDLFPPIRDFIQQLIDSLKTH
jgi:hypothetical protein